MAEFVIGFEQLLAKAAEVERAIAAGPIVPFGVLPQDIRPRLARYDFAEPRDLAETAADVEDMLRRWQVHVTHPRYLGLFNPSATPASAVADALVAMYNPQLAAWRTSPAANEIERHVLRWLMRKFGFAEESVATFTSGGMEANLSAVVVALQHRFPEYGEIGLRGLLATPAIYLTAGAHHGFKRIARVCGLGHQALRFVTMDADLKMDVNDLRRKVAEDRGAGLEPLMVVASAGSTAAGVIDPLDQVADFCQSEQIWFHADAAWGGAAAISPRLRNHLCGIERADSITCDAHKWFSVAMGAGMFFCRHANALLQAFDATASFMPGKTPDFLDPYTSSLQWSRRFMGLKLFLSLAERGESGYAHMIEHQTRMGEYLREALQRAGWRIVNRTPLPVVCFTRDGLVPAKILPEIYKRQIAWLSQADLGGAPVLRACITSYRTTEQDLDWIVAELTSLLEAEK